MVSFSRWEKLAATKMSKTVSLRVGAVLDSFKFRPVSEAMSVKHTHSIGAQSSRLAMQQRANDAETDAPASLTLFESNQSATLFVGT
jgi:hypothetical protein